MPVANDDDETRASTARTRSGRARANPRAPHSKKRAKEAAELARLNAAIALIPASAQTPLGRVNRRQRARALNGEQTAPSKEPVLNCTTFDELPLSATTRDGLAAAQFGSLTPIQRTSIPQALAGRDVLAAAPTGSGKTLAFIVPLVEKLWRNRWSADDPLGAIVLAPTRELALQIFEVLRKVGKFHSLSAGLVIGGKQFEGERLQVGSMNILVATPGRLLHHLDTVADIDCTSLQMLVLDEADRILDLGFEKTLDAILEHLPQERQTLLFSATQTKSVKSLARLSLSSPQYISVASRTEQERAEKEGDADTARNSENLPESVGTPLRLSQSYTIVPSHDKLLVLWSFLKTHVRSKIIVFFATGKQVRFAFDSFCRMRPGLSLLHLHGNMKQLRRMEVYEAFSRTKNAALFATDIASRGLDFPNVDWVVQVDCPDDASTYIHRVGRTARFRSNGRAMLFLGNGKEMQFLDRLAEMNISPVKVRINSQQIAPITPRISSTVASSRDLKSLAQRAFQFYLKSIYQQSDKGVFDTADHDIELLSKSFGLTVPPTVLFKGEDSSAAKITKAKAKTVFGYRERPETKPRPKYEEGPKRKLDDKPEEEDDDDILQFKRVHMPEDGDEPKESDSVPAVRVRKRMKLDLVNHMASANRIVFDKDGKPRRAGEIREEGDEEESDDEEEDDDNYNMDSYANKVAKRLEATSEEDKLREKERVRAKHAKRKEKLRKLNKTFKPHADMQQQLLEAMPSEYDEVEEEEEESDEDSEEEDGEDGGNEEGFEQEAAEKAALRILEGN